MSATSGALAQSSFVFTPEQQEFEQVVARLGREKFESGYLRRATTDEMCWEELRELGAHGLLGMGTPSELGGQDADPLFRGIACEQIAHADFNLAYLVFASELAGILLDGLDAGVAHPLIRDVTEGKR